jgi:hypothetical protein
MTAYPGALSSKARPMKSSDLRVALFMSPTSAATSSRLILLKYMVPADRRCLLRRAHERACRNRVRQSTSINSQRDLTRCSSPGPENEPARVPRRGDATPSAIPTPSCRWPDLSADPEIACADRDRRTTAASNGPRSRLKTAGFLAVWPQASPSGALPEFRARLVESGQPSLSWQIPPVIWLWHRRPSRPLPITRDTQGGFYSEGSPPASLARPSLRRARLVLVADLRRGWPPRFTGVLLPIPPHGPGSRSCRAATCRSRP